MTLNDSHIIDKNNSIAKIIDNQIVYITFKENSLSSASDIEEAFNSYITLTLNVPHLILFEVQQYATLDKSARDYLENTKLNARAVAIILTSLPQRIIYNFYVNFRKQDHPLKAFKTKESALIWLNSL